MNKMKLDFIQIGAHIGNEEDYVGQRLSTGELTCGIFIEPNPKAFAFLSQKFKNNSNFYLEQIAITNYNGKAILNIENFDNNGLSQIASINEEFIQNHPWSVGFSITKLKVNCETLNSLWQRYKLEHVKYLFVDTEGNDFNILINTDFSKLNIDKILFEHMHTDGVHVTSQNYYTLLEYLKNNGYTDIQQMGGDTIVSKSINF